VNGSESRWQQLLKLSNQPIDIASLVFFRVAFGVLMVGWCWIYLTSGRVTDLYVKPEFHFTYAYFAWVKPLPGNGMYLLFLVLLALAVLITVGYLYRIAATAFAVIFVYIFLLERTNYQNHYYLLSLISVWLPILPLNRYLSLDVAYGRTFELTTVPAWTLWLTQFHIGVPYFFGGVAKLTPDWLLGQPMGLYLAAKSSTPILGPLFSAPSAGLLFSWGGMLFDLLVVPALLWRRTRVFGFIASLLFHLANSTLFQIHVFPWFMIAATTIFFSPSWPRRLFSSAIPKIDSIEQTLPGCLSSKAAALILGYVAFHLLWPLRSQFNSTDTSWTECNHLFAWRMMLRAKEVGIGYAIVDPETGQVGNVDHQQFISTEQAEKFGRDPELIVQMAHFIADKFELETGKRPQVHAFVLTSLNGRKPQLMIDPNIDLASFHTKPFESRTYVVPLVEPLRAVPWDIPVSQWREHVEIPKISFLNSTSS
jgi:hypothetical protein